MAVDRCICRKVPFAHALELARLHACRTVAELQAYSALGTNCGLCIPYMQRALATGETDLPILGQAESERWISLAGFITKEER